MNLSEHYRCGFIAIVGRPNVGKSTLMNHLIGQKVSITSDKAQTTRHKITGICNMPQAQFIFVDTPGFQTRHRNAMNTRLNQNVTDTVNTVDAIAFVIEAMIFNAADRLVLEQLPKNKPVILVINKIDNAKNKIQLDRFIQEILSIYPFADHEIVSAKHTLRISYLLTKLEQFLPYSMPLYPDDMITDKSGRFLAAEIIREKLFRYLSEELPYAMNVEIEQFKQQNHISHIYATILVDKENQKPIVIGKNGSKLKKISTEARLDMEKLFENKVFLKVWVKVKSGWADDIRFLKELGL